MKVCLRMVFAFLLAGALLPAQPPGQAMASDHRDGPLASSLPAADLTDLYFFRSPTNANNVVLALDVYPRASGEPRSSYFSDNVRYIIHVVSCAAISGGTPYTSDIDILITFAGSGLTQTFSISGLTHTPMTGTVKQVVLGADSLVKIFCGPRDDPFFFDLDAYQAFAASPYTPTAGLRQSGAPQDAFAGADVSSIVLELPAYSLRCADAHTGTLRVWAETQKAAGATSKPGLRRFMP